MRRVCAMLAVFGSRRGRPVGARGARPPGYRGHARASTAADLRHSAAHLRSRRARVDDRHRQPGLPAVVLGRHPKGSDWKIDDPSTGQGVRVGRRLRGRRADGVLEGPGASGSSSRSRSRTRPGPRTSTSTSTRSRTRPSARKAVDFSESYYDVNQAIVIRRDSPIASATSVADLAAVQAGGSARHDELRPHLELYQRDTGAVPDPPGCRRGRQRRAGRRPRSRPPDRALHG